jgi:hypothetical protein
MSRYSESLKERILRHLKLGPKTALQLCEELQVERPHLGVTLTGMRRSDLILVVGNMPTKGKPPIYGIHGYAQTLDENPETIIADNAYAKATRRTYANIIFPGHGSRRGL